MFNNRGGVLTWWEDHSGAYTNVCLTESDSHGELGGEGEGVATQATVRRG